MTILVGHVLAMLTVLTVFAVLVVLTVLYEGCANTRLSFRSSFTCLSPQNRLLAGGCGLLLQSVGANCRFSGCEVLVRAVSSNCWCCWCC